MNVKPSCFYLIFLILVSVSCKDPADNGTGEAFDRGLLLDQIGNNHIVLAFVQFDENVEFLSRQLDTFAAAPDSFKLLSARQAWEKVFLDFQAIRGYTFGPGELSLIGDLNENLGTWPVDTTKVEQRIASSDLVMNDFRRDTRGLLALEYLLFEPNSLSRFQGSASSLRFDYLMALSQDIRNWAQTQKAAWVGYLPSFVADESKAAGSSTSELYNHWLQNFEGIKNFKLALPAGLRVGQTQAEPGLVESRYAHLSIKAIKENLEHVENLWYGNALDGSAGIGFDDYLDKVTGGKALKEATIAQWEAIHIQLARFQDTEDLAILVVQDPQKVEDLVNELQKMTHFLKSDLSSLLGISITYSSGDGD